MFSRSARDVVEDIGIEDLDDDLQEPHSTFLPVRYEGPLKAAEKFGDRAVHGQVQRSNAAQVALSKMEASGEILTTFALKELEVAKTSARACIIQQAGPFKVYVALTNTLNSPKRLVDFEHNTCDCLHWQQDGRPCYHAVGAFGKTDLMQRMMPHLPVGHAWFKCAWDVIYTVKGYKRCLGTGFVLLPQRHLLKSDPNVLVQLDTKTAGCW